MKHKPKMFVLLALMAGVSGCVTFKQPKEFKNRIMKVDPPILNQLPGAVKLAAAVTVKTVERV